VCSSGWTMCRHSPQTPPPIGCLLWIHVGLYVEPGSITTFPRKRSPDSHSAPHYTLIPHMIVLFPAIPLIYRFPALACVPCCDWLCVLVVPHVLGPPCPTWILVWCYSYTQPVVLFPTTLWIGPNFLCLVPLPFHMVTLQFPTGSFILYMQFTHHTHRLPTPPPSHKLHTTPAHSHVHHILDHWFLLRTFCNFHTLDVPQFTMHTVRLHIQLDGYPPVPHVL